MGSLPGCNGPAPYQAIPPSTKPMRVLAALGPKMLELAAERADGAHPYNVNPEHTAEARGILGPGQVSRELRRCAPGSHYKDARRQPVPRQVPASLARAPPEPASALWTEESPGKELVHCIQVGSPSGKRVFIKVS